jgi:Lrp/AsnC family leucine-responsive transcriptional regulator
MAKDLDEVDKAILSELASNARIPAKTLARQIRCHPNTMLQRLKKLETTGIIKKYTAQIDYGKVGYDLHVLFMAKVRKGRAGDLEQLKDLVAIKEIESLYATTGIWDLMGILRVKNREHLLEVLQKIGRNQIITKTASHLVLFTYKDPQDFNPF